MCNNFSILAIIWFSICTLAVSSCTPKTDAKKPIKIAIDVWAGYAQAHIAQEKGFFKKNNVDVELVRTTSYESLKLFTGGDTEGCFTTLADTLMVTATGHPARIVCIIDYSDSGDVIIGRSDIESLFELKGKTVSFEGVNTFSHIFVLTALTKAGLKEYDVKFENIAALDVLKALEEKKIDAGHTWDPIKSQALKKGYKVLSKAGDYPGIITDVLIFTPNMIKERPHEIRAIIKSLFEALDYLKAHRDESIKIVADRMGMSVQEMEEGIAGIYQPDIKENFTIMTTSTLPLSASVKMIIDFYLKRGQLFNVLSIDDVLEPKFIKSLAGKLESTE